MTSKLHNKKSFQAKVKISFQGLTWKKTLTFLFFLLLAFVFWLLQALQQSLETEVSIPIHYQNIPLEVNLANDTPTVIKIKIKNRGTSILQYTVGRKKNESLDVDLSSINKKNSSYTISKKDLEAMISSYLASGTTLISFTPDILDIKYQILQTKELPIVLSGQLVPATSYMLIDTMLLTPSKVYAYAPKNILDALSAIYTENIDIVNIQTPIKKKIKLISPKDVKLNISDVELNVSAEEFTEKVIRMPIVCKNQPENYKIHIFPLIAEITCPVTLTDYGKITESDFEISIDYFELLKSRDYTIRVTLSKKPVQIKTYRISPEKVEFLIEQKY